MAPMTRRTFCALTASLALPAWLRSAEQAPQRLVDVYLRLLKQRRVHMDNLHAYWKAGNFPINIVVPNKQVPIFVDPVGTHCAVGHLLKEENRQDLIKLVVRANNNIYVNDVKDGPFMDWILNSGLTKEECARIQPSYRWKNMPEYPSRPIVPPDQDIYASFSKQERIRIAKHLETVEGELRHGTNSSLSVALERLLPSLKSQMNLGTLGFKILTDKSQEALASVGNDTGMPVAVRVSFLDRNGQLLPARTVSGSGLGDGQRTLNPGARLQMNYDGSVARAFVEWQSKETIEDRYLTVASK